ncbi:MAG TPA: HD domain-containing protein [Candidatus Polarisedimenticolia bacterium]|nr:HD domain-containing protein [Candidatus Polarisedimenticolia bacterium]
MASKYLRDPVHGSIGFDKEREKLVIDLINTREFQRLRRIRQLGALFLTFHGAEHTRFTHSLGVAYMARRIFDSLLAGGQVQQKGRALERTRLVVIVAALLHDLGHGPFSHLYEKVFNDRRHEEWTRLIIRQARGEVGRLLRRAGMVDEVLGVYGRTYRPAFVSDIVSSQLDADRLDYLLRDSFMTGVAYGKYDLEWILTNLRLARRGGRDGELALAINGLKGYHAAEQFVIGRYLMYQQVYYHKTSRSAEQMIRTALQRLVDAHGETGRFPDPCPGSIRRLVETRGNLAVDDYLRLDDWLFLSAFQEWALAPQGKVDPILRDLCDRITRRHLFKTVRLTADTRHKAFGQAIEELNGRFRRRGLDPRYYLLEDDASDLPYHDLAYSDRMGTAPEDIGLAVRGRIVGYMSERTVSPLIDSIRNEPRKLQRLCFPAAMRSAVERRLKAFIASERQ